MKDTLTVVGFDMSFSNCGMASMEVSVETFEPVGLNWIELVQTEKSKDKKVKVRDDDLRRARELKAAMDRACVGADFAVAEIPGGSQSARSAKGSGIVLGILTSCPVPLIEIDELSVKTLTVGSKTATKQDMIDWAVNLYPDASWLTRKLKGEQTLIAKNEHMADACAVVHSGLKNEGKRYLLNF